ncbi:NADH dehydrogenase [ubiquinone] iron-sulfur protein 5 [Cynoglossus semilaevis]|uniref:NADH dehydrogenase [ubiquinone] iron-sulfur protein 5 n=1 Tax=Cynoglossus semilaevis TaxID=244447 RepID=A0A3P8VFK2_CYNSE|nr:NADH dehydrogenase [ubiquinone] iron-sulfur protein 5 [Cynoglossus semilaevis]XP_008329225.1 NADH dehydrogenase [ubiquinone] iron-sulfur protein 5 [Cynoglossus semilaevis]XP_016896485.1 NADH dehydrogenase [ubiquinone] iron-sulfur protein 5 [Cynoglossus semilaevis]XP_024920875.1 NADH dehydrogenase [ubiquinone] iron-sulfur protein 5 [Cynoglossus semilaevis]
MPFMDLHKHFGLELDRPLSNQSTKQPYSVAPRCYAFEKEWIECSHGIGRTRARIEYEDFMECMHRRKTFTRLKTILAQREKLIQEGKYTPPTCHTGEKDVRP